MHSFNSLFIEFLIISIVVPWSSADKISSILLTLIPGFLLMVLKIDNPNSVIWSFIWSLFGHGDLC